MKIKYLIALFAALGMLSGPASAVVVSPDQNILVLGDGIFDDPPPGGGESDNGTNINPVVPGGTNITSTSLVPKVNWVGIYAQAAVLSVIEIALGAASAGNAVLDFEIYGVTNVPALTKDVNGVPDSGQDWGVGSLLQTGYSNSTAVRTFGAGSYFLVKYGTLVAGSILSGGVSGIQHQYNVSITSISTSEVPIPAAAWLFGTALLGLIGLRRKVRSEKLTA